MSDKKLFVVGDIHGCVDELYELVEKLPLTKQSTLVFCGDYIDRGPHSRRVIDAILQLKRRYHVEALMGNHEAMLLDFLEDPYSSRAAMFIHNGGSATLASYADERGRYRFPDEHLAFFYRLKVVYETDEYFFAHAGVPDIPLEAIDLDLHRQELLWTRNILKSDFRWSKRIVHGHSPRPAVEFRDNRINVDTGCVFRGYLSAVELPTQRIYQVKQRGLAERTILRDISSRRRAIRFDGRVPVRIRARGKTYDCETVNYSEIGMYVRTTDDAGITASQSVEGSVGPDHPAEVGFQGQVIRRDEREDGVYLALATEATSEADD